ncbi:NACHT domain-containing protein [Actinoplanes cyaneus]|uniref:NACHT domain-containing protein n=1 Tax=Actinoplanes cyaneus TaxID=52696 RepID=UPI0022275979|nr:NACHT domain-containing protein [Actinoplanes cyaneus]
MLLAANGLVGRDLPLPSGESFVPERLEFETDQPTDDVTCISTTGRRIFFSAKRKTGDDAQSLGATVDQWVAQARARSWRDGDLLGLATAQLTGAMEHIRLALQRHHQRPGARGTVDEQKALSALKKRIAAAAPDEPHLQARVLDAAYVLVVSAVDPEDEDFQVTADRLENTIVAAGDGIAAAGALSHAFHTQAGKKSGSSMPDWVRTLRAAKLTVFADGTGPAGAAEHARQLALQGHLARLASQRGRIDLAMLAEDLPPLIVGDLADGLRVVVPDSGVRFPLRHPDRNTRPWLEPEPEPLLAIARRWPRLMLTGLPGMGKSTALRQLAARWAGDAMAPIPILVPLPKLADRCRQAADVTLSELCAAAAQSAPSGQRVDLVTVLEQRCQQGDAVLLLDAFDECGHRRSWLADGLHAILAGLPPHLGVVLATRDSSRPAARRLGLPTVDLAPAANLQQVLHHLLAHIADVRAVDAAHRERWIARRRGALRQALRGQPDIGGVPLLATLITLVVADSPTAPAPRGRAHLLRSAVQHSVLRWERHRPDTVGTEPGQPEQLLDGFAALGALLTSGPVSRAAAVHAVSAMLMQRWDVRGPGGAAALTEHILRFWDEHVGVFVATDSGLIEPRSRVFAEIGAAMAATWLPDDELAAWVSAAVTEPERRNALALTGELEPRVLPLLLVDSGDLVARAQSVISIIPRHQAVDEAQLTALLPLLINAADQTADQASAPGMPRKRDFLQALASLYLPADLRGWRRRALVQVCQTHEQRVVTAALAALTDAASDNQLLDAAQASAVRDVFALALEDMSRLNRSLSDSQPPGRGARLHRLEAQVALDSITHLSVLGEDVIPLIRQLGRSRGAGLSQDIDEALAGSGYAVPADRLPPIEQWSSVFPEQWTSLFKDDHILPVLNCAATIAEPADEIRAHQRWRLPDLCRLFDMINVRGATADGYLAAQREPDSVRLRWLKAAAIAGGLDLAAIATQATAAIAEHGNQPQPTIWTILSSPSPDRPPAADPHRLTDADLEGLLGAVAAESDWISASARQILENVTNDQLSDRLTRMLPHLPPDRYEPVAELARRIGTAPVIGAAPSTTGETTSRPTGPAALRSRFLATLMDDLRRSGGNTDES